MPSQPLFITEGGGWEVTNHPSFFSIGHPHPGQFLVVCFTTASLAAFSLALLLDSSAIFALVAAAARSGAALRSASNRSASARAASSLLAVASASIKAFSSSTKLRANLESATLISRRWRSSASLSRSTRSLSISKALRKLSGSARKRLYSSQLIVSCHGMWCRKQYLRRNPTQVTMGAPSAAPCIWPEPQPAPGQRNQSPC